MNLADNINNAWIIISRNKIRSFLTMLGIIIGVMAVIVVFSVGAGAQSLILNQIKSLGSNLVGVLPGKSEDKGPPVSVLGVVITTLTNDDVRAIAASIPAVEAATGYVKGIDTIAWGSNKIDTSFVGVGANYLNVEDTKVASGSFFSDEEDRSLSRVAVLGSQVAHDLFGDLDPIGQQIKIRRSSFSIIGVMRPRGTSGFQNQDDQIFVPITTAQKLLLGINYVNFVRVKITDSAQVEPSVERIKEVLRERHHIVNSDDDDFTVRSTSEGLSALMGVTDALRFFLVAIAAISLIVGGIGIMNIMLAAVEERTREIGLRKALGAKHRHIIRQFLVETTVITFLGGLIGIIMGVLISVAVGRLAESQGYSWDLVISPISIFLGLAVSLAIGFTFGLIPAQRASRLDPVEALRYE